MQIDIRDDNIGTISSIVFADTSDCDAYVLTMEGACSRISSVYQCVHLKSKEDALNLIKALQKAIELGNWDE